MSCLSLSVCLSELSLYSLANVGSGRPGELDFVTVNVAALRLRVAPLHDVSICKVPLALSFRLIVAKVALKEGAVRVKPLATDKLSIFEGADIFFFSLEEDVGALAVLVAICPAARVHILVQVGHDSFAVTTTLLPVAVVFAHILIRLFSNSRLLVVLP